MRTIVIGDIHGCYNELVRLIDTLVESGEYDGNVDKLVFLGDYIDRGENSRLVIKLIRELQKENENVIALMGNHEDMLIDYLDMRSNDWVWNGHYDTIKSYKGFDDDFEDDIEWMRNLPLYHEDDNFIYVHAGVDVYKPMEEQDRHTLLWIREEFIYNTKEYYKQVIFGHTPTTHLDGVSKPVYTFTYNVDVDTACVYGGALSALIIEDGEIGGFYQIQKEV